MNRIPFMARVRSALGADATPARLRAVADRMAHPPRHPLPACAKVAPEHREAHFIRCLETQGAEVIPVTDLAALPLAVESCLNRTGSRPRLLLGNDARLAVLPWTMPPTRWRPGEPVRDGDAALTHALAAVAETGTLVLASSAASPASLAFLPGLHLVALARDTLVGSFEDAFARLKETAPHRLPRAVNLVSGPSRTGDIGGRIVRGAHGPRRLAVLLYGPPIRAP